MYSVFLIMILVFLVIIINFIDQKNNLKKGIPKPALVSAYTIVSPSMVPNINVLDVIITTRVSDPAKIKVGDVITFNSTDYRSSGVTVTHRVKKIEKTIDEAIRNSSYSGIYGKVLLRLPKLGYIQYILSTVLGWLLLIIIPTVLIIGADIIKIIKTIKDDPNLKDKNKKKAPKILKKTTNLKKERSRYK